MEEKINYLRNCALLEFNIFKPSIKIVFKYYLKGIIINHTIAKIKYNMAFFFHNGLEG